MNTFGFFRRVGLRLALAGLTATALGLWLIFGQPDQTAQAEVQGNGAYRPAEQAASATYTLVCFVHFHNDNSGNLIGTHIGIYTLNWQVSDGSAVMLQMASGQNLPCAGSATLTVTGLAAGAGGFNTFTCALTEQQGCSLNIPVNGGGSVTGIPGQPALTVPAGQTAVLNITTAVPFFGVP
jgi:hypothetical protein